MKASPISSDVLSDRLPLARGRGLATARDFALALFFTPLDRLFAPPLLVAFFAMADNLLRLRNA
jgi:hypothetical protein